MTNSAGNVVELPATRTEFLFLSTQTACFLYPMIYIDINYMDFYLNTPYNMKRYVSKLYLSTDTDFQCTISFENMQYKRKISFTFSTQTVVLTFPVVLIL